MPTAPCLASPYASEDRTSLLMQHACLARAFEAASLRRPDAVAVRCAEETATYRQLRHRALQIAGALEQRGLGRGSLVAIYLERGIDMVAAMLGVCYAGAAYLPLDPSFPSARIQQTLSDAQPALVLTEAALQQQLGEPAPPSLLVPLVAHAPADPHTGMQAQPDDLAYVIYTSGSTGTPKGVMISQHNVLRLLAQTEAWFRFDENDVWTMFHSFAFDFSVWEIWGALLTGGTLVIVPYETSRSPEEFYALLSRERVTVLNQTPTAFGLLSRAVEQRDLPLALRYVVFGGEALNLRALRPWVQRFGVERPRLINMYGITETTVHVTYRRISANDVDAEADSLIGVPIPDLCIYLLDENKQRVPRGSVGEMYIGGAGVALGYLNRSELTAGRFVPNCVDTRGGRLYRSGDLARRRMDGELVYLGRADRQIKINGFRVEPGEVEAVLADVPGVQQTCVLAVEAAEGAHLLAAYFVADRPIARETLAATMEARLPGHMRPTFYRRLATFPLTVNGKIDRDALPRPEVLKHAFDPSAAAKPLARQIADVWAAVLQSDHASETENFFDAGGTSLQLLALRTALQAKLGRDIPVLWLFEHTTPQALAARLAPAQPDAPAADAVSRADRQRQAFARSRTQRSQR